MRLSAVSQHCQPLVYFSFVYILYILSFALCRQHCSHQNLTSTSAVSHQFLFFRLQFFVYFLHVCMFGTSCGSGSLQLPHSMVLSLVQLPRCCCRAVACSWAAALGCCYGMRVWIRVLSSLGWSVFLCTCLLCSVFVSFFWSSV